jgi:hypothetical protein
MVKLAIVCQLDRIVAPNENWIMNLGLTREGMWHDLKYHFNIRRDELKEITNEFPAEHRTKYRTGTKHKPLLHRCV